MKIEVKYKGEDASSLRSIIEDVWNSLPAAARDAIGGVCDTVVLHGFRQLSTASFNHKTRTIPVNGEQLKEHSASGRRGVVAHEYGHAFDYATRLRPMKLGDDALRKDIPTAEKKAYEHAATWGFKADVLKANEEFPSRFRPSW